MTDDDHKIFDVFDRLPKKLYTQKILKLYLCNQRWVDLSGIYDYISVLSSASVNFDELFLCFLGITTKQGPTQLMCWEKDAKRRRKGHKRRLLRPMLLMLLGCLLSPLLNHHLSISSHLWNSSRRRSPKRAKTSTLEVGTSKGGQLVSHDLAFPKGVNISLTSVESDVLTASSKEDLMTDWFELQSRALATAPFLSNEVSREPTKEVEDLKIKLADSKSSLKLAIESNASLNDKVTKLTTDLATSQVDIDDLKIRCGDLEKRDKDRLAEVRQVEEKLIEITQDRDEVIVERDDFVSQRNRLEQELVYLKYYIHGVHVEGFNQAMCQVVLLYGILVEDNEFDLGKDVFQG